MIRNPMPNQDEKSKQPLVDEIRRFHQTKLRTALILFACGLAGLLLPIMPGWLFILLAAWLVFPDQSEKLWARLKEALVKNKQTS